MTTENATGDAPRLYQAVLNHLQTSLWNDIRNARTLAWMTTGLLFSQRSTLPAWLPHIHSSATFAQSTERRFRRWLENPAIDPTRIYGPLVTRALRDWGEHTLILALDTSVLFEKFCLIRVSVLFRGRAVPLVSRFSSTRAPKSARLNCSPFWPKSRRCSISWACTRSACWRIEDSALQN